MTDLSKKRVAVLVYDGFEEAEFTEPAKALREAGAKVEVVSSERQPLQAFQHHQPSATKIDVDKTLSEVSPDDYDAVMLPGGALNADEMRADEAAKAFVKKAYDEGKPMAVICHAPWILASTGIARGHKLTSWPGIQDDLRSAGAQWEDSEVVVDGNIVSSRSPKDLPAFNRAMVELFAGK
jgi:protease I